MLQHGTIDRALLPALLRTASGWQDMGTLEAAANTAIDSLRRQRRENAGADGLRGRIMVPLDELIRTDQPEYLDDPDFPADRRVRIVQMLHRFNRSVFAYQRFFSILKPELQRIARMTGRPARVLELASGAGELALAMAAISRQQKQLFAITGSDYFPEHVAACRAKARERQLPVEFIELNAFDMGALAENSYDLIVITQSIHHFSPGQVAMMISQSLRVASAGFVGIDGRRSLMLYPVLSSVGLLMRSRDFLHDSITSLRKFYTDSELELIGRIAAPASQVAVRPAHPGYSVLTVFR